MKWSPPEHHQAWPSKDRQGPARVFNRRHQGEMPSSAISSPGNRPEQLFHGRAKKDLRSLRGGLWIPSTHTVSQPTHPTPRCHLSEEIREAQHFTFFKRNIYLKGTSNLLKVCVCVGKACTTAEMQEGGREERTGSLPQALFRENFF